MITNKDGERCDTQCPDQVPTSRQRGELCPSSRKTGGRRSPFTRDTQSSHLQDSNRVVPLLLGAGRWVLGYCPVVDTHKVTGSDRLQHLPCPSHGTNDYHRWGCQIRPQSAFSTCFAPVRSPQNIVGGIAKSGSDCLQHLPCTTQEAKEHLRKDCQIRLALASTPVLKPARRPRSILKGVAKSGSNCPQLLPRTSQETTEYLTRDCQNRLRLPTAPASHQTGGQGISPTT